MSRRRHLTIKHETTTTTTVTAEEADTIPVLAWAPGWDGRLAPQHYRAQRHGQVTRCLDFLTLWAMSSPADASVPERLVPDAAIILRAGPGATPLELTLGRSV